MGLLPKDFEILPPYDDRIFKVLLTKPEAEPLLKYLATEIVQRPVRSVLVRNTELPVTNTEEKAERFDVNCHIDDDSQADIEMQGSRMKEEKDDDHSNLFARSIYNLCDLHSSQPSKGRRYGELSRTFQVMFCNYTVFHNKPDFIHPYSMRLDKDNELLHNAVQGMFVELTKLDEVLKKPVEQMTNMEKFLVFLKYAGNPDYRDIVNKVIESREELAVAGEVLMGISKDERERAIFRSRRIALAEYESNMLTAERIGEQRSDKKWQNVVAEKDNMLAEKDNTLAKKDAENERLRAQIAELQAQLGKSSR
jgi:predicted transposase/invertase (TIGR01784 family)